jgi:hypothetical protein
MLDAQSQNCGLIIDRRCIDGFTDEQLVKEAARLVRSLGFAGPRLVEDVRSKQ